MSLSGVERSRYRLCDDKLGIVVVDGDRLLKYVLRAGRFETVEGARSGSGCWLVYSLGEFLAYPISVAAREGALNWTSPSSVSRSSVPARWRRSMIEVRRPARDDDWVGVVFVFSRGLNRGLGIALSGALKRGLGRALVASKLLRLASILLSARLGLCFALLNASLGAMSWRGEGSDSST